MLWHCNVRDHFESLWQNPLSIFILSFSLLNFNFIPGNYVPSSVMTFLISLAKTEDQCNIRTQCWLLETVLKEVYSIGGKMLLSFIHPLLLPEMCSQCLEVQETSCVLEDTKLCCKDRSLVTKPPWSFHTSLGQHSFRLLLQDRLWSILCLAYLCLCYYKLNVIVATSSE